MRRVRPKLVVISKNIRDRAIDIEGLTKAQLKENMKQSKMTQHPKMKTLKTVEFHKFQSGDSTPNQLLELYHTFISSLEKGEYIILVICDISKAFDRAWHKD